MSLNNVSVRFLSIFFAGLLFSANNLCAQKKTSATNHTAFTAGTNINVVNDSLLKQNVKKVSATIPTDSFLNSRVRTDSTSKKTTSSKIKTRFVPDPQRALWLSLVLPGAGQIYNRKYWKLPIIYGGFIGCTYALLWNQQMYKDYSQAYIDIMDDNPNTASYLKMLPLGYDITGREEQFKTIFKHKKDFYRKYRDLSIFAFIGVYLISVADAYIDAQLSTFDISKDLSLHLEPAVFQQKNFTCNSNAVGLQCSFSFK